MRAHAKSIFPGSFPYRAEPRSLSEVGRRGGTSTSLRSRHGWPESRVGCHQLHNREDTMRIAQNQDPKTRANTLEHLSSILALREPKKWLSQACSPRSLSQRSFIASCSRRLPCSVLGPVLMPPCSLQRPPRPLPGAWQGFPVERAKAPQGFHRPSGSWRFFGTRRRSFPAASIALARSRSREA